MAKNVFKNRTPSMDQLPAKNIGTLPNMKPQTQTDPYQGQMKDWYKQATSQGYQPIYRSPVDGNPYAVDANGNRTKVAEQQFQTMYPQELGNTGGEFWGGPKSDYLTADAYNAAQMQQQPQPISQPQPLGQMNTAWGGPTSYPGPQGMTYGDGMGGGIVSAGEVPNTSLQSPYMQRQMAQFFQSGMNDTTAAMDDRYSEIQGMRTQNKIDNAYGNVIAPIAGGLLSFFTGDMGAAQAGQTARDTAYKRRQDIMQHLGNYTNDAQQNQMNGFNMMMQSDPQSIKNQTMMANSMANMARAQSYGQQVNNQNWQGQQRAALNWQQLAQKDAQFARTAQQADMRIRQEAQRIQYEGQRIGLSQQEIAMKQEQMAQNYSARLQQMADQRMFQQQNHEDRMYGYDQGNRRMDQQDEQFWGNLQNQNYQRANEQGYDSGTQSSYPKYSQDFRNANSAPPSRGGMKLDAQGAMKFLQMAGGDKNKARQMAQQSGYSF